MTRRWLAAAVLVAVLALAGIFGWRVYRGGEGANDASRVPPDWFSWLHHHIDDVPDRALPPARPWQKPAVPNMTGTAFAYRPQGALEKGGNRAAATGDYEAWSPDA